jgi:hypothetical protein
MSEDSPRKASDILLELESKVNVVFQHLQNIDSNIKLILNRLSSNISKKIDISPEIQQISEVKHNISTENTNSLKNTEKEEEFTFVQVNNDIPISTRKVAVQQRIMYADGKNICLASVELKDVNGNVVKKMRTNAMGKWISALDPGKYFVHIRKAANKSNQDVEMNFEIQIQESDRPIELPSAKI